MGELEFVGMLPEAIELARNRTRLMQRTWALYGALDLEQLVLSAYLQGAWDGWQACERENELGEQ